MPSTYKVCIFWTNAPATVAGISICTSVMIEARVTIESLFFHFGVTIKIRQIIFILVYNSRISSNGTSVFLDFKVLCKSWFFNFTLSYIFTSLQCLKSGHLYSGKYSKILRENLVMYHTQSSH